MPAVGDRQGGRAGPPDCPASSPGRTLTSDGKPRIVYLGAEYCPYCATERWAMVNALSRFGTFKNLKITTSSATDVDANTPTFSFYGSTFTSPYIKFEPHRVGGQQGEPARDPDFRAAGPREQVRQVALRGGWRLDLTTRRHDPVHRHREPVHHLGRDSTT